MSPSRKSSSILVQSLPRCEVEVVAGLAVAVFVREETVRVDEKLYVRYVYVCVCVSDVYQMISQSDMYYCECIPTQ